VYTNKLETLVKEENNEVKATWRIPADLFRQLKHKAIDENTSVTDQVVKALRQFLDKKK
jgi:hypothetical protein